MDEFFLQLLTGRRVVSIVGAGGKSSLMAYLARLLTARGWRVGVVTTTKTTKPAHVCRSEADCMTCWARGAYAECGEDAENGKIGPPENALMGWLLQAADIVLCEADGSHKLPCKAPAAHEPVILPGSDLVIGVMGMDALGKPVGKICHRPEHVCALLGCEGDHLLTETDMAALLLAENGTRKGVGDAAYCVVLNKCDDAQRYAAAQRVALLLAKMEHTCTALTCLKKE